MRSEFSGSVLQYKAGQVVFDKSYGFEDRQSKINNKTYTKFNLGSVNKLFTKIAIAQLIQRGELHLEDLAISYVPELKKADMDKITMAHLLSMSSGLGDYLEDPSYTSAKKRFQKMEEYLSLISSYDLDFVPGSSTQYSNLGYELLGIIVGRVSGMDYHDYIQTHILDISGMNNTGYFTRDDDTPDLAIGYIKDGDAYIPNWDQRSYRGSAAGGGYSTTHDMLNLGLALFEFQLLDEDHTSLLFKNFKQGSQNDSYLFIGGGGPGINATYYLNIQKGECVVVLANLDPPAASTVNDIFKGKSGGAKKPKRRN